jgi:hypothetical protein
MGVSTAAVGVRVGVSLALVLHLVAGNSPLAAPRPRPRAGEPGLNNFVKASLASYGANLALDPYALQNMHIVALNTSDFAVDGLIYRVAFHGLRDLVADYAYTTVSSDKASGFISFTCKVPTISYSGRFMLDGKVSEEEEEKEGAAEGVAMVQRFFGGMGAFTLGSKFTPQFHGEVHFDVDVKGGGHAQLRRSAVYMSFDDYFEYDRSIHFDDIFAGSGVSPAKQEQILDEVASQVRHGFKNQVESYLRASTIDKLQSDFDKMTLEEILGGDAKKFPETF